MVEFECEMFKENHIAGVAKNIVEFVCELQKNHFANEAQNMVEFVCEF